jgi:hypothetical protein
VNLTVALLQLGQTASNHAPDGLSCRPVRSSRPGDVDPRHASSVCD